MSKEPKFIDDESLIEEVTVTAYRIKNSNLTNMDKEVALYAAATHTHCRDCDAVISKHQTLCSSCNTKSSIKRYSAKEKFDPTDYIYSDYTDRFYELSELDLLKELVEEGNITDVNVLRLYNTTPKIPQLDDGAFSDYEDSDGDLPWSLLDLIDEFNKKVVEQNIKVHEVDFDSPANITLDQILAA